MSAAFTVSRSHHVPARTGLAFVADAGACIRITDLRGQQPVDFWAFNRAHVGEYLSCEHTKPSIEKLYPETGDAAYTTRRRAIVTLIADNSPGQHDMQFAACDPTRYAQLGHDGYHPSCQENLHTALDSVGIELSFTPQPWNLFTNFFLNTDGTFEVKAPATRPGDNLILRVEMDALMVVSACPQDQNQTCGGTPSDIQVDIAD